MSKLKLLYYVILFSLFNSFPVYAQEATEGRIAEHNVVSLIALAGLLLFAHLVRKSRKSD